MRRLNNELVDMIKNEDINQEIKNDILPPKYIDASTDTSSIPVEENNQKDGSVVFGRFCSVQRKKYTV